MRFNFDPDQRAEFEKRLAVRDAAETSAFIKRKAEQQRALEAMGNEHVDRQMEHAGDA